MMERGAKRTFFLCVCAQSQQVFFIKPKILYKTAQKKIEMTERFQFQLLSFFILLAAVLGQNEEHRNLQVGCMQPFVL